MTQKLQFRPLSQGDAAEDYEVDHAGRQKSELPVDLHTEITARVAGTLD